MISVRLNRSRRGFVLGEAMVAIAVLASASVLVVEMATWSLGERARMDGRLEAVDAAANVLEAAQARPWTELTPEWAAQQHLPKFIKERWADCQMQVSVEADKQRPTLKQVKVEIKWKDPGHASWAPITMTGRFASHETGEKS